jgi:copper homeostasis protein
MDHLRQLVEWADDRIIIMPGSGLRSSNLREIALATGAKEFHSSARVNLPSAMEYINASMREELTQTALDGSEVRNMRNILDGLAAENQG